MKLAISGNLEIDVIVEKPRLVFSVTINNVTIKDIKMLLLPTDQKVLATIEPVDAKGNPAKIDGQPNWNSSSTDIANVAPEPDDGSGKWSAWVTPVGAVGTCQINVIADADLGSGITQITGVLDLEVVSGQAVSFQISTAAPVPQAAGKK
jgi:hypothetical protein